jgi:hypothetical protein
MHAELITHGDLIFPAKEAQIGRENPMREFPDNVAEQLSALQAMKAPELRSLWRATFGRAHPGWVQREFLLCALAYHFQAKAYGGLNPAVKRRLRVYADDLQAGTQKRTPATARIKPGTRLVREWGAETHVVTTLEADYEYRGKRYKSLSEIARLITRSRWSGPAFFGLKEKPAGNARSANVKGP